MAYAGDLESPEIYLLWVRLSPSVLPVSVSSTTQTQEHMTTHLAKHMHSKLEIVGKLVTYNNGLPLYRIDKMIKNCPTVHVFFFVLAHINRATLYSQEFSNEHDAINCANKLQLRWRTIHQIRELDTLNKRQLLRIADSPTQVGSA